MPRTIGRRAYAEMFGPTVGDRVRLADTGLIIEVEQDYTLRAGGYGEEVKFGGGKTIRDGMAQSQRTNAWTGTGPSGGGAVDTVLTNALVIDHTGIFKADIGLRAGRIASIGKAGNPDVQPGVDIIIGPGTEVISCEGNIVTAGGIDSHIHRLDERVLVRPHALPEELVRHRSAGKLGDALEQLERLPPG